MIDFLSPNIPRPFLAVFLLVSTAQRALLVNDNSVGLPTDHNKERSKPLAHNLVKGLVRQLDGAISRLSPVRGSGVKLQPYSHVQ